MSAVPDIAVLLQQMADTARKLWSTSALWRSMAADPAHRMKLQEGLAFLDSYRQALADGHRETTRTRDMLATALRKRWGVRA